MYKLIYVTEFLVQSSFRNPIEFYYNWIVILRIMYDVWCVMTGFHIMSCLCIYVFWHVLHLVASFSQKGSMEQGIYEYYYYYVKSFSIWAVKITLQKWKSDNTLHNCSTLFHTEVVEFYAWLWDKSPPKTNSTTFLCMTVPSTPSKK
jgi:hypothetical protein